MIRKKFQVLILLAILTLLASSCIKSVIDVKDLSYEDIIKKQYSNPPSGMQVEKILWSKVINNNEVILFFLNKDKGVSVSRIAKVKSKWRAYVAAPAERSGNEEVSWQWSLLSNPPEEEKAAVAAVVWGYIYSPEVDKVLVGTEKEKEVLKEAEILELDDYQIKLYYYLTDDESGFEYNTVAAYNELGKVLFNNRIHANGK